MESMEKIYQIHAKTVYGFLITKVKNPDLAEELTQETFYQAVTSIHRFEGSSSVSTWLCGIAKNVWFNYCKKHNDSFDSINDMDLLSSETIESTYFAE